MGRTPRYVEAAYVSMGQSALLCASVPSTARKGKIMESPWLDCVRFKQEDARYKAGHMERAH